MYIKLNLTNGQTVSAFVDEATVEYLNEVIIEEGCYDDESEITDYDYVDYANLMSGEFVFIFDKKYDLEKDVESFEVDRYAMESEEDKEKRMAKYRTVSQDAMDYATELKDLGWEVEWESNEENGYRCALKKDGVYAVSNYMADDQALQVGFSDMIENLSY